VDCVAVVNTGHKQTGSTEGHAIAGTSPLQNARVADAPRRLDICHTAILKCDFNALANIIELDWQGHGNKNSISIKNVQIKAFKVEHYANINYSDRKGIKNVNGYMISSGGIRIAFLGDSAYMRYRTEDAVRLSQPEEVDWQKQVNPEGTDIDLCIIPIGDSHYKINHMGPDDAVKLFGKIRGKKLLPIHYNTFILSSPDEEPDPQKILLDSLRKINLEDVVFFKIPDKKTLFPDLGAECVLYEQ